MNESPGGFAGAVSRRLKDDISTPSAGRAAQQHQAQSRDRPAGGEHGDVETGNRPALEEPNPRRVDPERKR